MLSDGSDLVAKLAQLVVQSIDLLTQLADLGGAPLFLSDGSLESLDRGFQLAGRDALVHVFASLGYPMSSYRARACDASSSDRIRSVSQSR